MTISTQRHAQMSTSYPKSNIFMAAKDSPVAPWKRALNYFVVVVAVVAVVGVSLSMAGIALNLISWCNIARASGMVSALRCSSRYSVLLGV